MTRQRRRGARRHANVRIEAAVEDVENLVVVREIEHQADPEVSWNVGFEAVERREPLRLNTRTPPR